LIVDNHFKLYAAAYLVLRRGDSVLLSRRLNTGFMDGHWSMVAGHLNGGESALAAMIREAREEAGIVVNPVALTPRLCMHRKALTREITNLEPDKCSELEFFPISNLPDNMVPNVRYALESMARNQIYVEFGWDK
jgi:8-oxo-dGTP diphosphatase